MQTIENSPIQSEFPKPSFSFTSRQLILISIIGTLVLLFIFGLGTRAGEKRALRKYFAQPTPTLTPIPPSPTAVPPTSPPTPVNQSCFEGDDCVIGIEQGSQIIYSRGICKNGVCIPRPTSPARREEVESKPR